MSIDSNHDLPAPPLPPSDREKVSEAWLTAGAQLHGGAVDIVSILTAANVQIVTLSDEKMKDHLAFAKPQVNTVFVRGSLRDALYRKDPNATFDLAHEFAHLVLHRGALAKPLMITGNTPLSWKPAEERQEDQAWDLARSIMLPRMFVTGDESPRDIVVQFNAPLSHVEIRLAQLRRERRKLRKPSLDLPMKVHAVWARAATHPDYDPDFTRLSKSGMRVDAASYNRLSGPFGWYVLWDQIYAKSEAEFW